MGQKLELHRPTEMLESEKLSVRSQPWTSSTVQTQRLRITAELSNFRKLTLIRKSTVRKQKHNLPMSYKLLRSNKRSEMRKFKFKLSKEGNRLRLKSKRSRGRRRSSPPLSSSPPRLRRTKFKLLLRVIEQKLLNLPRLRVKRSDSLELQMPELLRLSAEQRPRA